MAKEAARRDSISKRREYFRIGFVLALLLGVLGIFLIYNAWPLLNGRSVILATRPVDPFDLLRGQYLSINYEIGTIPVIEGALVGDNAYVVLKEDDSGIWRYKDALLVEPDKGIFIRGNIKNIGGKSMRIEYGIEQYFFERGAEISGRNLTVEIKLSDNGGARIVRLLEDGKPVEIKYRDRGIFGN